VAAGLLASLPFGVFSSFEQRDPLDEPGLLEGGESAAYVASGDAGEVGQPGHGGIDPGRSVVGVQQPEEPVVDRQED
jgi:hypothetical protein